MYINNNLSDAIDKNCDISKIKILTFFDNWKSLDEIRIRFSQKFTQIFFNIWNHIVKINLISSRLLKLMCIKYCVLIFNIEKVCLIN